MSKTTALEQWTPLANKMDQPAPRESPLDTLITGAREVAGFARRYWEDTPECPGLMSAGPGLPRSIVGCPVRKGRSW